MFKVYDWIMQGRDWLMRRIDPDYIIDRGYVEKPSQLRGGSAGITERYTRGNVRAQLAPLLSVKRHEKRLGEAVRIKWTESRTCTND